VTDGGAGPAAGDAPPSEPAAGPDGRPSGAGAPAAAPPAETRPLDAIALAAEVVLDRLQTMLEWLLRRLKRYRAGRANWWEK
jgi:hypothetical protein